MNKVFSFSHHPNHQGEIPWLKICTLITSLLTIVFSSTSVFLRLPYAQESIGNDTSHDDISKVPFQNWKNYLFVGPLMFFNVTPQAFAQGVFFASLMPISKRLGICCPIIGGISFFCLVSFLTLYFVKYKGKYPFSYIVRSFLCSFMAPCIVMNPESSLIFWSSMISTVAHMILLSSLLVIHEYFGGFINNIDFTYVYILLPLVFCTLLSSLALDKLSKETIRQYLHLTFLLENSSCCITRWR